MKRPLLSVAKITKARSQVLLGRGTSRRDRSRTSDGNTTCGCLTCGRGNPLMQWMCRVFAATTVTTMGTGYCKTTVAPVEEEGDTTGRWREKGG